MNETMEAAEIKQCERQKPHPSHAWWRNEGDYRRCPGIVPDCPTEVIDPKVEALCLHPSRSNWPIWHYDGRWSCSLDKGHEVGHVAYNFHSVDEGVAWEGPWVGDPDPNE